MSNMSSEKRSILDRATSPPAPERLIEIDDDASGSASGDTSSDDGNTTYHGIIPFTELYRGWDKPTTAKSKLDQLHQAGFIGPVEYVLTQWINTWKCMAILRDDCMGELRVDVHVSKKRQAVEKAADELHQKIVYAQKNGLYLRPRLVGIDAINCPSVPEPITSGAPFELVDFLLLT